MKELDKIKFDCVDCYIDKIYNFDKNLLKIRQDHE